MAPSPIRVFALPLTRSSVRSSTTATHSTPTIYYHVSQHVTTSNPSSPSSSPSTRSDKDLVWNQPTTWPSGAVAKASSLWLSWGEKPTYQDPSGQSKTLKERATEWKYWTWVKGEGLMDRVEWEEWALKSINPSVRVGGEVGEMEKKDDQGVKVVDPIKKEEDAPRIPFLIPNHPSMDPSTIIPHLKTYLNHRIPYHKKLMTRSLLLTPLMLPFGLLPVVPNFPFLIAAWRAFSHYRAWRGAEWLLKLVEGGRMEVKVDKGLDEALGRVGVGAVEGGKTGLGKQGGEEVDHAPDETSTPKSLIFGQAEDGVEGENAIQKTNALLDGAVPDGSKETGSSTAQGEVSRNDDGATPDPKDTDVAPDATGTPDSLIYKPSSSSATSATSTSSSSTTDEPVLEFENIAKLTSTFGLSASEVVDLTRAVMQIKEKAKKAAKSDQ